MWFPAYVWIFALSAGSVAVAADDSAKACAASPTVSPLAAKTASAGYLSNFTNRAGSIRAVSKSMLNSAIEAAKTDKPGRQIVFKSIPQLSAKADSDDPMCERLEKQTSEKPIEFNDKRFATVDDLNDWIMNFTQGEGADGKSLYEQCPGNCSPQYTWHIEPANGDLNVNARVVCGPPRDRDSDAYNLSIGLADACPKKSE
jgi:hypothetical protein